MNDFTRAIFNQEQQPEIIAYFRDGRSATYTARILDDLRRDNNTAEIVDTETGEVLFCRDLLIREAAEMIAGSMEYIGTPEDEIIAEAATLTNAELFDYITE